MTKYEAEVVLGNEAVTVQFECETGGQVDYLWGQYGMSTHINTVTEIEPEIIKLEED